MRSATRHSRRAQAGSSPSPVAATSAPSTYPCFSWRRTTRNAVATRSPPVRRICAKTASSSSMTRPLRAKLAGLSFGVLLVFGAAWALPAKAESVPASFDCAKAGSVVEKLICSQAVLRWNDLALSRAYAAAKAEAVGAARDDLLLGQRDWVRERDRRCIADRTFAELSDTSKELGKQAYDCLQSVYLDRRRQLQDLAVAPLVPRGLGEID